MSDSASLFDYLPAQRAAPILPPDAKPRERWIGKCHRCKAHSARDYTDSRIIPTGRGMYATTRREMGRTDQHGRWIAAERDGTCPACQAWGWSSHKVVGYVTATTCDSRCTSATGHQCECACGGRNHGRAFLQCD